MVQVLPAVTRSLLLAAALAIPFTPAFLQGQEYSDPFDQRNLPVVHMLMDRGDYDNAAKACEMAIRRGQTFEEWHLLRIEALQTMGRADEAFKAAKAALDGSPENLALLMAQHRLASTYGKKDLADQTIQQVNAAARKITPAQRKAKDMILLGQAALAAGADPQKILQQYLEPAKKKPEAAAAACQAIGELALQKEDYERAANEFREGLKHDATNAALRLGLARALEPSESAKCLEQLGLILEENPRFPAALILQAEILIGSEKHTDADRLLRQAISVNRQHPEAWALLSVIATLERNNLPEAEKYRTEALKGWPSNPEVDHLIGRCISRAYRFREGAAHQRASLAMQPDFAPARVQLCNDLLRLGEEDEAWKLANEIRTSDGYNAAAHNIGILEDEMRGFVTIQDKDSILRLPKRDQLIYADRALEILREAKEKLGTKYNLTFTKPVLVEFFPTQQDFAIRTFGNLGGQGILGACFGTVVTMNSPGSISARRSNWESTLWHEFCHVVTLTVTHNRMPRWLSEGISVYEEGLRNPACGMDMTLTWRRFILDDKALTPARTLSSAFREPKTGEHLMFAYFQAGQTVDFIIEKYGLEKFQAMLASLANGKQINHALGECVGSLDNFEREFAERMKQKAITLVQQGDLSEPPADKLKRDDPADVARYVKERPFNYEGLRLHAQNLIRGGQWQPALEVARRMISLFPRDVEGACGYELAAAASRGAKQFTEEANFLRELSMRSGDNTSAYTRLIELDSASNNWPAVEQDSRWLMAVNPFLKAPHEALVRAYTALNRPDDAIKHLRHLQTLGPDNPVEVNFRLAQLLRDKDPAASRRYLIDALSDAPRHREALTLLESLHRTP